MNSYPIEFLSHPRPLMFVAGLGTEPAGDAAAAASAAVASPRASNEIPLASPENEADAPQLGTVVPAGSSVASMARDPREGEFEILARDLRTALAPYTAPPRVAVRGEEEHDFRVVLVDKGVRMPLRKLPADQGGHSPLSPLTPSSPLYPDGLIAPVWVRKHADAIPSVFVLFLRLYETPARAQGSSALGDSVLADAERAREREADEALVQEIADRRRRLGERGIKLTVVLMASAATLDAEGLDARLSSIRRASQLSAKASLFVLTPVKPDELPDFVRSLMAALYEPALEYYAAHGKRVRRKRSRAPQNTPQQPSSPTPRSRSGSLATTSRSRAGSVIAKPLSHQGWMVRYDWKAGWLAEIRGDLDLARRHYEDCWNELARMFESTQLLPPRTKRWAEAKVLADCLAARICKLHLYEDQAPKVLIPFYVHLRRFAELSRGWGIGEETYEFWSWVARQYRLFGEMLSIAIDNGYQVPPVPLPAYAPPPPPSLHPPSEEELTMPVSSANALHVLHPPAYYFYAAAMCTMERKARYDTALAGDANLAAAPGFATEKTVDHAALIIELLTKAQSLLAAGSQEDAALAPYVSLRVAQAHAMAGHHAEAISVLRPLVASARDEDRTPRARTSLLRLLQHTWLVSAQATGDVETAAQLLIETMGPGERDDHALPQDDLLGLLGTTQPASTAPMDVNLAGPDAMLVARAGFRRGEAPTYSAVEFQLELGAPPGVDISRLEFARVRVILGDGREVVVSHGAGVTRDVSVGTIATGATTEAPADLIFPPGETLILTGQVESTETCDVEVLDVVVELERDKWVIRLHVDPAPLETWTTKGLRFEPLGGVSPSVSFTPRDHRLAVETEQAPVAFVDEALPITVRVKSEDDRALKVTLTVLLQPGEEPDGATVSVGEERSDAMVKDVDLGIVPAHGAVERVITLFGPAPGTKIVDVSVVSVDAEDAGEDNAHAHEFTRTAVVPVIEPFSIASSASVASARTGFAMVSAVLSVPGPRGITVTNMEIVPAQDSGVRLVGSTLGDVWPQDWDHMTEYALSARLALAADVRPPHPPPCGELRVSWRPTAGGDNADLEQVTALPLPALVPPPPEAYVTASLASPAAVRTHSPFSVGVTLSNAHPTDAAWVTVQNDTAEGFAWSGERAARVGPVPPGGSTAVRLQAVSVGAPGWQTLPHTSVWLGDGPDRREVRVAPPRDRPAGSVLVHP